MRSCQSEGAKPNGRHCGYPPIDTPPVPHRRECEARWPRRGRRANPAGRSLPSNLSYLTLSPLHVPGSLQGTTSPRQTDTIGNEAEDMLSAFHGLFHGHHSPAEISCAC